MSDSTDLILKDLMLCIRLQVQQIKQAMWEGLVTEDDACDKVAFSILCLLDGVADMEPFDLVYDGKVINESIMLHDLY